VQKVCKQLYTDPVIDEKENYSNLKSQCYFKLAELVNEGKIFLDAHNLKQRKLITEELEQIKRKSTDTETKLSIISKETARKY
jgi:phage terminase large subunit